MKVLIIDDDVDLLDVVGYALRREGFNVQIAADGQQALQRIQSSKPDVVLLDIRLSKTNGLEVLRRIRESDDIPVIVLTALNDEETVLKSFNLGADDFITKPFSMRQLTARIRAVMRRANHAQKVEAGRALALGEATLDLDSHELAVAGRNVRLTPTEFKLLHILGMNEGRVVSTSRLIEYIWGYNNEEDTGLLRTHISHIRAKLQQLGVGTAIDITGIPGVGYRLRCADRAHGRD
jgi:DNA-binding response OmpR family regulator